MKTLLHVLLFLASLLFTSTCLRQFDVLPFWGWTANKLEVVRSQGDEYDTIFLGSSRLHYAAVPDVFDARCAELGRPSRSYSLAFSGTRMLDTVRILDWLVVNKPRNCKRVVIELNTTSQDIRTTQWLTDQEIEMHAPCTFPGRMASILTSRKSWWVRTQEAGYCMVHTLLCQLCVGQGARIVCDNLESMRGPRLTRTGAVPDRGWVAVEESALPYMREFHEGFVADFSPYEPALVGKLADVAPDWLDGNNLPGALLDCVRRLRLVGIEPVFVVMPTLNWDFQGRGDVAAMRETVRVLELDRPATNRPIWDRAAFYDPSHLNTQGARAFSRHLAECLVECEDLPLDKDPSPRWLPSSGISLTVRRAADGSSRLEFEADELPFVGECMVIASNERRETTLEGGVVLSVPWPTPHVAPLQRTSSYRAIGSVDWAGLDPQQGIHLQLAVLDGTRVIGTSPVFELPPRR